MRLPTLLWLKRFFGLLSFTLLIWLTLILADVFGYTFPWEARQLSGGFRAELADRQIALISGHAGFDSGAVCQDSQGQVTLTEAAVNRAIADATAARLEGLGASVMLLDEYDARLAGLRADLLLSLHADSCISASGFKAANYVLSRIPITEARLLACINQHYAAGTGLQEHPNTVTHDMTEYHAFRRIHHETPAAILEMGFLGGDQQILTQEEERIAQAIVLAVRCFLAPETLPDTLPDTLPESLPESQSDRSSLESTTE